ncbi:hypothetical protein P154DRAFT_443631 [Amniculicola lignicola CBS 123094]|uniref:VWFA domain-containing protein n=1 Tax=Amniculicola lignicola CBS 123094 TaxID=1392246 RepID=A0A6A5W6B1_9PLEO|nr:hypothetical protein P154DRAFT_443631 [Amniculicola lignicola CBS 123094]
MFVSLKKKLSKRGSNPLGGTPSTGNSRSLSGPTSPDKTFSTSRSGHLSVGSNPFRSTSPSPAPATRRPQSMNVNPFSTPANEPPPAYSAGPANTQSLSPPVAPFAASTADDPYAFLKSFDTIFLIDDSGSMAGRSWRETGRALEAITPICTTRDADGIDIYFLNHPDSSVYKNVTSAGTVVEIFQTVRPGGGTPTGQRLNQILRPYLARYQQAPETTKPINIIIITDGEPSDDVESPIIMAAKKLDKFDAPAWQVGIQFFQVGKEPGAREHLKQLDDGLAELAGDDELRDIVDTVPFTGADNSELSAAGILKVVLGSVNRRLDRNSKELHRQK